MVGLIMRTMTPIIVAAWFHPPLHPRSIRIRDGNGRVARALTNVDSSSRRSAFHLFVGPANLRTEYIKALELADQAQLSTLAENIRPVRTEMPSSKL